MRLLAGCCVAACAWAIASGPALAAKGTVRGAEMSGFGRAIFKFDTLPKATARQSNGILIITFDEPVTLTSEKLVTELPNYVSAVRLDPDGKGMRLALVKGFRPNLMEAGERLFLDLLPETWRGLAPSLPPDVIEDLSRRAREAEDTARRLLRKKASEETRELAFKIGTTPAFTRVVFETPVVAPVDFVKNGDRAELIFDANLQLDAAKLKAALPPMIVGVEATADNGQLHVAIDLPSGAEVRGFREDETYVIDITPPKPAPKSVAKDKPKDAKGDTKGEAKGDMKAEPKADMKAESKAEPKGDPKAFSKVEPKGDATTDAHPASPGEQHSATADLPSRPVAPQPMADLPSRSLPPAVPGAPASPAAAGAQPVAVTVPLAPFDRAPAMAQAVPQQRADMKVEAVSDKDTLRLELGVPSKTPIAVFERAGVLWVAAEAAGTFDPGQVVKVAPVLVRQVDMRRQGRLSMMRLTLARPALVRAAATASGWIVTLGDDVAGASEPITLRRDAGDDGRTIVEAPFKDVGSVHWVSDPEVGDNLAVVTGSIAPRGLLKQQTFVDFKALPSAQGLVISPVSDDVSVKSGIDDVVIARDGGLSVSLAPVTMASPANGEPAQLVIERDSWSKLKAGNVRERGRELLTAAADAPSRSRAEARLAIARFEVANTLGVEALGTLQVLSGDNPDFARDRAVLLLSAVALLQSNRAEDAAKILQADVIKDDPEAVLWRAYADAKQLRWPQALTGFRRSAAVLNTYPEDLQGQIGLSYAEAAIEGRDFGLAQRTLENVEGLDRESVDRDKLALLQARVADGQGRVEEALGAYEKLAERANRPVQAEARLRIIALNLKDHSMTPEAATDGLESLAVSWRGDEIEARTLGLLGQLYAEQERWRDAFSTAHKINELFPDHEVTRALYDEAGAKFEALFIDGKADSIPRLDAIALYYDFKDFTPPGRRGDEMIRRLAERLVQLDLLGEAADLLQHQVDNRLTGVAKANVATRLAIIQLMNKQPAKAYQALRESKLADMPSELKRSRSLIEARALSDLSRTDLALEMLAAENGPEVERLRADILWQSRRWRDAGETFERIVGDRWKGIEPLDDRARSDVLRSAIAYGLGEEPLSMERLRAKFAGKMADSADSRAFAVITSPTGARASEYRDLAKTIASADTLAEFLAEYRNRYPDLPPAPPAKPKPQDPQAEKAPAEKPPAAKPEAEKPAAAAEQKPAGANG
jgi:hypothetical protein